MATSKELLGSFVRIKKNEYGRKEQMGICADNPFTGQDLYFIQTAGIENQYARGDEMEVIFCKDQVIEILQTAQEWSLEVETAEKLKKANELCDRILKPKEDTNN
jgi:hypothetical protein